MQSPLLRPLLCLLPGLVLGSPLLAQDTARSAQPARGDVIHYDYLEDGVLRGGVVAVDPKNPLMANIPQAERMAASDFTTVLDNGPSANRVDLVFVGDGYTQGELTTYANEVDTIYPAFFAEPPLDAYMSYFNVHRVDVVSVDSGVDNDPSQGVNKNTALDMGYWCGGTQRLLCVNVNKAFNAANNAPEVDQVLAIANSSMYGGAGYNNLGTLAGRNGSTVELALHEFGHSFPGLADEYTYGGPTTYSGPEPSGWNISLLDEAGLLANQSKWHYWLDLPNVSAFEGGGYSTFGIYRPTSNSKMRNLGRPFEEVNSERFIRQIYRTVDPIDDASPAGVYGEADTLFVTPLQPVYHSLDVQWNLNGFDIPGATGKTLELGTLGLRRGVYAVGVTVVDNTPMVRNVTNRAMVMTETRTWTVVAGIGRGPELRGMVTR